MRKIILSLLLSIPFLMNAQVATENLIPFTLDTDQDGMANVAEDDDDNDLVPDNDDFFPLDMALSGPVTAVDVVKASDDAGLRSNTANTSGNNYGADPAIQTKNDQRSFICKFSIPDENITSATFTLFTDSEDDILAVYFLPFDWAEDTITFNGMDFNGQVLLGTTDLPTDGKYTFDVPVSMLPEGGGGFTLWIYDPNDPQGSIENLYTKEFIDDAGGALGDYAPSMTCTYIVADAPRVDVDASSESEIYLNDGPLQVGFRLTQAPTDTVYIPFELSDPAIAMINGNQVLKFTSSDWNVYQNLLIDPVGPGLFAIKIRPLHSNDPYYNGINPFDLENYLIQPTDLLNLTGWTVTTGTSLNDQLQAVSALGSNTFDFRIVEGPSGFNVVENNGRVLFTPLSNQVGVHDVIIEVTDDNGYISIFQTTVTVVDGGVPDPVGIYVDPNAPDDPAADGSAALPYNDIGEAVSAAVTSMETNIYIRGGEYQVTSVNIISDSASVNAPIVIQPLAGENVKFNFDIRAVFEFTETAENITLQNVEIDGGTDEVDFWCIVAQALYYDLTIPRGGGLAVILEGENLTLQDCYIHDCYQKAAEIKGRYINIYGNIIHSIATTSLSGGHGIMRQQKGREFFTDDDPAKYRWDIQDNLIFNVEQRIYSWVPSKGFMEMTLDEGKPILIDDPKDTDGIQEFMKARIKNNVIAFGSIDHIRLKSTPNLEVSNNSIYSESEEADGITDKGGDTPTPQFTNFIAMNNAVQTFNTRTAIEIDDCINQTVAAGGTPIVSDNRYAGGTAKPTPYSGLIDQGNVDLFVDPNNGNFDLNPALSLPSTVGVDPIVLDSLEAKAARFDVTVRWDVWTNDNIKLTQTILDNIPGVNDGVVGNETAFTDEGELKSSTEHPLYLEFTTTADFQALTGATPVMDFLLNARYTDWYLDIVANYKNAAGLDYPRVRWGSSVLKQDQVFKNDWLLHSQITSDTTNTLIEALHSYVSLDGDILIDFDNYIAPVGACFDLIIADSIDSQNPGDLFDRVIFAGDTLDMYELTIEDRPGGLQALQLKVITDDCKMVINTNDAGLGSLRAAIDCAVDGDTIVIAAGLAGDTIKLTSTKLLVDKNVSIISELPSLVVQNCIAGQDMEIAPGKAVVFKNFTILSDTFSNNGILNCEDMIFRSKDGQVLANFQNAVGSTLNIDGEVRIE